MIYQSEKMAYRPVMEVLKGRVNDVLICENAEDERGGYYTLWVLKDHDTVKKLIRIMEKSAFPYESCIEMFTSQNTYCIAFDYVSERKLTDFYMANHIAMETSGEISMNLVLKCMISKLPYPILYLALMQNQVQLLKDNDIALSYCIDLEDLDENCDEAVCVRACAMIVRELLQKKGIKRNTGYKLLLKKIPKHTYREFGELYRDIRISMAAMKKLPLWASIKLFFRTHKKILFRILVVCCLVLVVITITRALTEVIFGNDFFEKLMINNFKQIGTESMLQ